IVVTYSVQVPVSRDPGVGKCQLFAEPRAMRVWVDPDKLVGYNLSITEVNQAIAAQNLAVSAGIVGSPPNPIELRVSAPVVVNGELESVSDFENIILRSNTNGSVVRLSDVARVEV